MCVKKGTMVGSCQEAAAANVVPMLFVFGFGYRGVRIARLCREPRPPSPRRIDRVFHRRDLHREVTRNHRPQILFSAQHPPTHPHTYTLWSKFVSDLYIQEARAQHNDSIRLGSFYRHCLSLNEHRELYASTVERQGLKGRRRILTIVEQSSATVCSPR